MYCIGMVAVAVENKLYLYPRVYRMLEQNINHMRECRHSFRHSFGCAKCSSYYDKMNDNVYTQWFGFESFPVGVVALIFFNVFFAISFVYTQWFGFESFLVGVVIVKIITDPISSDEKGDSLFRCLFSPVCYHAPATKLGERSFSGASSTPLNCSQQQNAKQLITTTGLLLTFLAFVPCVFPVHTEGREDNSASQRVM